MITLPRPRGLVLYHSNDCPHCADAKQLVSKLRHDTRARIRDIEIESCSRDDPFCKRLEFVPTFANCSSEGCVEVSPKEFVDLAKNGRKKK